MVTDFIRSSILDATTEATSKVQFIPRSQDSLGVYDQPAPLNRFNPVYVMLEVEDTSEELAEEEKNRVVPALRTGIVTARPLLFSRAVRV